MGQAAPPAAGPHTNDFARYGPFRCAIACGYTARMSLTRLVMVGEDVAFDLAGPDQRVFDVPGASVVLGSLATVIVTDTGDDATLSRARSLGWAGAAGGSTLGARMLATDPAAEIR